MLKSEEGREAREDVVQSSVFPDIFPKEKPKDQKRDSSKDVPSIPAPVEEDDTT